MTHRNTGLTPVDLVDGRQCWPGEDTDEEPEFPSAVTAGNMTPHPDPAAPAAAAPAPGELPPTVPETAAAADGQPTPA